MGEILVSLKHLLANVSNPRIRQIWLHAFPEVRHVLRRTSFQPVERLDSKRAELLKRVSAYLLRHCSEQMQGT